MSSSPYINPTSKNQLSIPYSVPQGYTNGTHFSIYGVGGYMEVYYLSDLYLSAGTIPINISYDSSGSVTTLILNSDNVSSGRRKLGMLAYVYETDSIYQYYIPNYDTAFNTATGSSAYQKRYTIFGSYETYVYPNSATTSLIGGWTGDTIEGVGGATSSNARWRKLSFSGGSSSGGTLSGDYLPLSGGTVTGNTRFTLGLTATTISATTYLNLPSFTGGTGSTLQYFITGSTPGGTINDGDRWFNTTTGAELVYVDDGNSSQWIEPNPGNIFDTYVTGGTYSNGTAVFTNNSGSTFSVTGFTTPFTGNTSATCINSIYVTNVYGCSPINFKDLIIGESGLTTSILTATTITNSYLDTYYVRDNTGTVALDVTNRQLKKSDGSTTILDWENGVLSGMTSVFVGTLSASTYQNVAGSLVGSYLPLSGGTLTGGTIFQSGVTANTISASTYQNLPTDIRTTGGTYFNNTFTFTNNTGGTYSVLFNTFTGATINGNLTVTGTTSSPTFTGNSLTLSNSASTISLNNTTQQQIRFFSGGIGSPTYNTYSAGAKIILSDNIDSISSGYAIGVDAGSLWYGSDLAGNGHDWYAGTRKLMSLASSSGLELVGLGGPTTTTMTISGTSVLGSKGGVGYIDFLKVVNNFSGATNPNKWFRVNQTGGLEILNSVYTAPTLIISDNGIVTITSPASVTSNSATNNALNVGTKGQLFDDGNFHIHSSSGSVWINAIDGSAIRIGTQTNSGTSPVIVDTSTVGHSFFTKVQSGFNVAFGTEITMDNLKVRINGTGGSGGLVQGGAVSGSFAAYTTLVGNVAGAALQGDTNSGGITFTTTYQNISSGQKTLSAGGDTTTLHLIDTTNSRIYRITAIHCQGTTGGYTSIERMA